MRYRQTADNKIQFKESTQFKLIKTSLSQLAAGTVITLTAMNGYGQESVKKCDTAIVQVERSPIKTAMLEPMEGGGILMGVVKDGAGAVIAGANVTITVILNDEQRRATVTTSEYGRFRFENLPDGQYEVMVKATGFEDAQTITAVVAGLETSIDTSLNVDASELTGIIVTSSPAEEMLYHYEEKRLLTQSEEEDPSDLEADPDTTMLNQGEESIDLVAEFFSAVRDHEVEAVKKSLEKGVPINIGDEYGDTALVYGKYNKKMVKQLLAWGADPALANKFGVTPLMYASLDDDLRVAKCLLSRRVPINAIDNKGRSALLFAVVGGKLKMVKLLVKKGANINVQDVDGKTPLAYTHI